MRSKLNYLIGVSLKRKIKTKLFMWLNIVLAIVVILLININTIINFFGGDFDKKSKIYIVDNIGAYSLFNEQLDMTSEILNGDKQNDYELIKSDKSIDELSDLIMEDSLESDSIILEFYNDENNPFLVKMITKKYLNYNDTSLINAALNNTKVSIAAVYSNIPIDILNDIYSSVDIERIYLEENQNQEFNIMYTLVEVFVPFLFFPVSILIMLIIQMIGAEINDEKSTRGMEIIISNVSPTTHFFSKIIASNLFVIMQSLLLIIYVMIGFTISSKFTTGLSQDMIDSFMNFISASMGTNFVFAIIIIIILIILSFLAYSVLSGVLASVTTNAEDFQQIQTPIFMISIVGMYFGLMAGFFEGSMFIKVLSYVPFISAILSPTLLVLGQIGIIDIIISIIVIIITNYLLIKYGLKIYKVGILNYSSKDLWKKMFKALKG